MNNKIVIPILFIVLAIVQISVPAYMINRNETTLTEGGLYKFKAAPIDPYDPFKGRFVRLRLEESEIAAPDAHLYFSGQKVYALLHKDKEGYAKITKLVSEKPDSENYLKTRIVSAYNKKIRLDLQFSRFYLNEKDAPLAEKAYRENVRNNKKRNAYVAVRIKNGFPVIEDLYIDHKPVREYINEMR